ncbi:MAG: M48 family metallopeptidase [Spirochaetales bacterium]|nr:M48 family metallopeptidase [Spirochaetales bacterium]
MEKIMESDLKVQYELRRKRGQKGVYLKIRSDGSLLVTAGEFVSDAYIADLVRSKSAWYEKAVSTRTVEHDYRTGDVFRMLGHELVLRQVFDAAENRCLVRGGELYLFLKDKSAPSSLRQRLIREEYARKLDEYLKIRIPFWAQRMGLGTPDFRINNAVRQWASCSAAGRLSFSVKSASLNPDLLDYLIVHELSHLRYMNHGPQFKALVASVLPDCKDLKTRLGREYFNSFI